MDRHAAVRESGVDRAVAVAREVERLIDLLVVMLAVPAEHECDVDLREPARPFLLLLALHLDGKGLERLLELLQQQHRVYCRAARSTAEQHLWRAHRLAPAQDARFIDAP